MISSTLATATLIDGGSLALAALGVTGLIYARQARRRRS